MNFKIAFRHLLRNKLYAGLNILGLSLGIASFLIIYFFIQNELSFDGYHANSDNIYRILETNHKDPTIVNGGINAVIGPMAAEAIPEIEAFTRVESWQKAVQIPRLRDTTMAFSSIAVDQGFFKLFDIEIIDGPQPDFNKNPNTVLISEKMAGRFFNDRPIGDLIKVRGVEYMIEGVFENMPSNSSIKGDFIFPFETANGWRANSFTDMGVNYFDQTYFLLSDQATGTDIESKLNDISESTLAEGVVRAKLSLQALKDVHFSMEVDDHVFSKTDKDYVYIFTIVGVFILACSFFNYVSMAVAQSLERTREIGVKKVMGANKYAIYLQFLLESFFMVVLAFVISAVMLESILPSFEQLLDRELASSIKFSGELWLMAILFVLLLTVSSAIYPALLSTRSNLTLQLKNATFKFSSLRLLNAFSVFQVIIFMTLISVAFVSQKQLKFMQEEDLGFDRDNLMVIRGYFLGNQAEVLENEFRQTPGVLDITFATSVPTIVTGSQKIRGYDFNVYNFGVADNYFETMGMDLLAGRSFEESDGPNDILINEAAFEAFGLGDDVLGKSFEVGEQKFKVIGIVSDFHFMSKKEPVKPIFFKKPGAMFPPSMVIKLTNSDQMSTIAAIEDVYKDIQGRALNFSFLDEQIDAQYRHERTMVTMIQSGTIMSAFVAFLGLFGIAGYYTKRREKEMGIRKVLGARFLNIQKTLNVSNIWKLIIAALISVPVIYYWMNDWLNTFAYRIDFPIGIVFGALGLAALVTLSTAIIHSIKASRVNPVEILKDE